MRYRQVKQCYQSPRGCDRCTVRDLCGNYTWTRSDDYYEQQQKKQKGLK